MRAAAILSALMCSVAITPAAIGKAIVRVSIASKRGSLSSCRSLSYADGSPLSIVSREMALVKVSAPGAKARSDIINYADIFRARVVDISSESLMVEITGNPDKIDAFIDLMKPFGVKEVARTGITALSRGTKSVRIEE